MAAERTRPAWRRNWTRYRALLLMFVPAVAFFLVFHYVPMYGIVIAFKDFRISEGILGGTWNGLDNFRALLGGESFGRALRNTVIISLLRLGTGFFAPIILALMLNELRLAWYKKTVQTLSYLPHLFSWVILGGIFRMVFASDGPVNAMVASVGGDPVQFMTNRYWFISVIILTGIWKSVGFGAVIYLAALAGIPPELYEAAAVDGAGRWKQTTHITLPCLVPTIVTLFILSLGGILNAGFDQIYNLYNPAVFSTTDILDTFVLRSLESMEFALGTAAGLFKSVVGLVLIVTVNAIARRISHGEQGIW